MRGEGEVAFAKHSQAAPFETVEPMPVGQLGRAVPLMPAAPGFSTGSASAGQYT